MTPEPEIVGHYQRSGARDRIRAELTAAGIDEGALSGVDQFHLGGRAATMAMLESLDIGEHGRILDVGCGIGGVSRTIATTTGCSVTGVDLTPTFIEIADELSRLVGLADSTEFDVADALALPYGDDAFDAATLVHVGMNIADKSALFAELVRVVQPGGSLHVYDIMRIGDGDITFPVPWSSTPSTSFVATPDQYTAAITAAGADPSEPIDRLELVRQAMASMTQSPPAINLSHLMGEDWPTMFTNLGSCLQRGVLSPTEIIARVT